MADTVKKTTTATRLRRGSGWQESTAEKKTAALKAPAAKPVAKPVAVPKPAAAPKAPPAKPASASKVAPVTDGSGDKITKLKNVVYATGKRKNSVARVYLAPGKGVIKVNDTEMTAYFKRPVLQMILRQPFGIAKREGQYDVRAFVSGGGLSGQAGAIKHGISKAIAIIEPDARKQLKGAGFLTRDSRVVERKHYGFRKARRSTQYSKR